MVKLSLDISKHILIWSNARLLHVNEHIIHEVSWAYPRFQNWGTVERPRLQGREVWGGVSLCKISLLL